MALATFDTLEFVDTLEKAGIPEPQARAISVAFRKAHESSDIATKRDIDDLRKDMDIRFANVDAKIEKTKFDLLRWMVGLFIGNFAFLVGIFWKLMSIPGVY